MPFGLTDEDMHNLVHGKEPSYLVTSAVIDCKTKNKVVTSRYHTGNTVHQRSYRCIDTPEKLQLMLAEISGVTEFALDTETTGLDPHLARLVGISLSFEPFHAYYISIGHGVGLDIDTVLSAMRPILEDPSVGKLGQNAKFEWKIFQKYGVALRGIVGDAMIADAILSPESKRHNLDLLTEQHLGESKIPTTALLGKGKNTITMDKVPIDQVTEYACEDADTAFRLCRLLEGQLRENGLYDLYRDIEVPCIPILARMEFIGVKINFEAMSILEGKLTSRLLKLERVIHDEAGEVFNINSQRQLARILFEKMGYEAAKCTPKGSPSTDKEVLRGLSDQGYGLPLYLLKYKEVKTLLSTFIHGLRQKRNPVTGRVHTEFNQVGTVTGRFSSSKPNLQNIPDRGMFGQPIRRLFIAEDEDWCILRADYSQIELRVLAHFSQDPLLLKAFLEGRDVHSQTAAEVFGIPLEEVTDKQRSSAKAINFGIDYGMTEWGLSKRLGIPLDQAQVYIDTYLKRYAGVKAYMREMVVRAWKIGYVETLYHRRRYLPDIKSVDSRASKRAERQAVNTPIQGSAADLIKIAMIKVDQALQARHLKSRILIQVHDELVLEVLKSELDEVRTIVKEEMEGAVRLDVPLVVDIGLGATWGDAKENGL